MSCGVNKIPDLIGPISRPIWHLSFVFVSDVLLYSKPISSRSLQLENDQLIVLFTLPCRSASHPHSAPRLPSLPWRQPAVGLLEGRTEFTFTSLLTMAFLLSQRSQDLITMPRIKLDLKSKGSWLCGQLRWWRQMEQDTPTT